MGVNPNEIDMRKLFLTSFTFKTAELEFTEQRLVVVTKEDLENSNENPPNDLDIAYKKVNKWFVVAFPQSELLSVVVYPAIDELPGEHSKYGTGYGHSGSLPLTPGMTEVYDPRTERQRVVDWLINDIDPNTTNGNIILSYLRRNRTKQVD